MSATITSTPPAILESGAAIDARVMDLRGALDLHLRRLRLLDEYSRRQQQNWFPKAAVSAPSVMLSTIRAVEKTVIAYLAGGKPTWKVATYGGYAGAAQQEEGRGKRDAKFERIARAIFHHVDRQSERDLLYEPVERAVRQGEIILQYGWLSSAQRRIDDPVMPEMQGDQAIALDGGPVGPDTLRSLVEQAGEHPSPFRHRFPLYVKVHDRFRVYYELDPYGEPVEVYQAYTSRASLLAEEFPDWDGSARYQPHDTVQVVQAWVGRWWALAVDGDLVIPAREHLYGPRPPFVIEQCAPENVADRSTDWGVAEVRAGQPFCLDMLEAYKRASTYASLKQVILENAAFGGILIENADPRRFQDSADGTLDAEGLVMGPGTATPLYPGEKVVPAPIQPLPAAIAEYLNEAADDMAQLSFSSRLLTGEAQGDPSGYGIEQVRQAAMARLMPYKSSLDRALSRLFEKILGVLSINWAEEWGDSVTLTGMRDGEFFSEQITPMDLFPAPDHVEVRIFPAVPQNRIAETQSLLAQWQAGSLDILSVMEENGVSDPQDEFESVLLHKEQMENPMARANAVQQIIYQRRMKAGERNVPPPVPVGPDGLPLAPQGPPGVGGPPPAPGQSPAPAGLAGGANLGAPPPQPPGMAPNAAGIGPGAAMPPAGPPGARGPAPQQRPAMRPQGVPGSPNMPLQVPRRRAPGGR